MFVFKAKLKSRARAELIVLPFLDKGRACAPLGALEKRVAPPITAKDFTGKRGESSLLYWSGEKEGRALLIGLGKGDSVEVLRRAYSEVAKFCHAKGVRHINLLLPSTLPLPHPHPP